MKYCSKCGKELFDEAVICPSCGCPTETKALPQDDRQKSKMRTALLLNIFAVIIEFAACFIYSGLTLTETDYGQAFENMLSDPITYRLLSLVTVSAVLSIIYAITFNINIIRKIFIWIYLLSVCATVGYFALFSPIYFFTTVCGTGVLFPVPIVLQAIAAVKVLKTLR